ncbi:MAG TPA: MFS transporter [Candidatus Acidoferrum sp.]|nr:MFS transporter [Candidatus Acidoferrum sp.]
MSDPNTTLSAATAQTNTHANTPANTDAGEAKKTRNITVLLFGGFIVNGVVTVILGPVLPVLISRWGLNDSQVAWFFPAQFIGSWLGTVVSSWLIARKGYRLPIGLGYALLGIGVAGLSSGNLIGALAATFLFGFGYGMLTPGTNLYIAETGGARRAAAVSLVNFTWGIGAVACPLLVSFALRGHHLSLFLWLVTVAGLAISLLVFLAPWNRKSGAEEKTAAQDGKARNIPHVGFILAALFFIYVGAETGTGGWVAALAKRMVNGEGTSYTRVPMFFYGGLLVGRGLAPLVLRRVRENNLVLMALSLAACGMLVLHRASTIAVMDVGVALAGLGLACIYPIYIAWLSLWYRERARKVGGVMFALAALGGAFGPWLVGLVSKQTGSLRTGLLVTLGNVLVMLVLVYVLRREIHP